jgi:hypothetical protein
MTRFEDDREDDRDEEKEDQDGPMRALAKLRHVDPPPSLVASVMQRIAEPQPPSLWRWFRKPWVIELRISPLGAAAVCFGLVLAGALMAGPPRPGAVLSRAPAPTATASSPAAAAAETATAATAATAAATAERPILVRFKLDAKGAKRVALAGSFNGWSVDRTVLEPTSESGVFVGTLALPPGVHEYMFIVDGRWVTDPAAEERRPDGFGRQNALLRL